MKTLAYINAQSPDISGRGLHGRNAEFWQGEVELGYDAIMVYPGCANAAAIRQAYTRHNVEIADWTIPDTAKAFIPTSERLQDGMWAGRDVVIVGGGPSLKGFDWHRLQDFDCKVIAVNRAYETTDPDMVFGVDNQFFEWAETGRFGRDNRAKWQRLSCPIVTATTYGAGARYVHVRAHKDGAIGASLRDGVYHGGNSGLGAIHTACLLGARRVYLLGFDCLPTGTGNTAHWHDGYQARQRDDVYTRMSRRFNEASDTLNGMTEIVNCNPDSGLKCFAFGDLPDGPLTVTPDDMPVFATFVTPDYRPVLEKHLQPTADALGLHLEVVEYAESGDWIANCARKADAVAEVRKRYRTHGVVWVDADAEINRMPVYFAGLRNSAVDIAAHRLPCGEFLGGTVYFGKGKRVTTAINEWRKRCKSSARRYKTVDQRHLDDIIRETPALNFVELPDSYCRIFDHKQQRSQHPAITHYQASRRMRLAK